MRTDLIEQKKRNYAIIQQMMNEGKSVKEMMEATGRSSQTVREAIKVLTPEGEVKENLTYAEHDKINTPLVEVNGKTYRDVTDLFLSSEWKGAEEDGDD